MPPPLKISIPSLSTSARSSKDVRLLWFRPRRVMVLDDVVEDVVEDVDEEVGVCG